MQNQFDVLSVCKVSSQEDNLEILIFSVLGADLHLLCCVPPPLTPALRVGSV